MTVVDPQPLIVFPCHYEFKAFGPGEAQFFERVRGAVASVVPVSRQAMKSRPSRGGNYQCVSVLVTLQNRAQLDGIYAALRQIDDLKYLL